MAATRKEGQAGIVRRPPTPAQARGAQAERLAEAFLAGHGVSTIARNVRCRGGEVDLVCLAHDLLVFVEVRLRGSDSFGGAAQSITTRKQQRLIIAARWWLAYAGRAHAGRACRFDALLLSRLDMTAITWIPGAFDAPES